MTVSAQRIIPAIYACKKQVAGLDDEATWRDFLRRAAGIDSLRAMTGPQLGRVLDALHAAGAPRTGRRKPLADPQQRMARGLWIELARAGAARDPSDRALDAFVKRVTGTAALAWCRGPELNHAIEALKSWRERWLRQCLRDVAEPAAPRPGWSREQMLVEVLWEALQAAGAIASGAELWTWLRRHYEVMAPDGLAPGQAEDAVWQLATWLRRARARR